MLVAHDRGRPRHASARVERRKQGALLDGDVVQKAARELAERHGRAREVAGADARARVVEQPVESFVVGAERQTDRSGSGLLVDHAATQCMRGSNRRGRSALAVSRKACGSPNATCKPCARPLARAAFVRDIGLSRGVQRALGAMKTRLPDVEHWKAQVKCQAGCPVSTDAGAYVQLIAQGRDEEAYLVARAPNPFASVCGRVCAAPCEDACRRGAIDAPISIRALKRFVTEKHGVESRRPDTQDQLLEHLVEHGNRYAGHLPTRPFVAGLEGNQARKKVAIIGAGPAGLAAAHDLALLGYAVTVLEASEEPGGMLRFGIPEYRLPRSLLQAEIAKIQAL